MMARRKGTVALVSGGKDSVHALVRALDEGLKVEEILTIIPPAYDLMFHHPNTEFVELQAEAMGIPWRAVKFNEVRNHVAFLSEVLDSIRAGCLVVGTIKSKYQRRLLEDACIATGVRLYSPLWGLDENALLKRYLLEEMKIIFTSVSAMGFGPEWLGRTMDIEALKEISYFSRKFGVNPSAEGGEYETFVLDSSAFTSKVVIGRAESIWKGDHGVYYIREARLVEKGLEVRDRA